MRAVIWTPAAEGDLEEILYYIGVSAGRPSTAQRIGEEIRLAVDHHQTIGAPDRRHPDLPAAWSYLIFKRWIIDYELTADEMIVHRVVDASRDLPTQFEQW